MNKRLVNKFLANQATPKETEQVLEWLDTQEGGRYLQERVDIDYELMDRKDTRYGS